MSVAHSLLSRLPASAELHSPDPHPSPVSGGAGESGAMLSSPEHEPSSRLEQRPAVEGCVQTLRLYCHVQCMEEKNILHVTQRRWKDETVLCASDDFKQFNVTFWIVCRRFTETQC